MTTALDQDYRYNNDLDDLDDDAWMGDDDWYVAECPACGSPIDYCQGHGEYGDPAGFAILVAHDLDDHSGCLDGSECRALY